MDGDVPIFSIFRIRACVRIRLAWTENSPHKMASYHSGFIDLDSKIDSKDCRQWQPIFASNNGQIQWTFLIRCRQKNKFTINNHLRANIF